MDIGDFLNVLLMLLIISFAIIITYRLAFLNMKYQTALNPFLIYQVAVTLNYFSANIGNFEAVIDSPGTELVEYRISSYSESFLEYNPAYVAAGVCTIRDHLREVLFDAVSAALSTVFVGKYFSPLDNMKFGKDFVKEFLKITFMETVKAYAISKIMEGAFALISIFTSGSGKDIREMMINVLKFMSLKENNLAKLAEDAKKDLMSDFPYTFARIAGAGIARMIMNKVLSASGIGVVVAFAINFFIEFVDNLIDILNGIFNVEFNCLYNTNQIGKQVIFNVVEKIEYTPNNNLRLNFINVEECGIKLSEYQENWLYKITGYQPCPDGRAYRLFNISIRKNEELNTIDIKANYKQVKKN